jgi:hypothetical protein
MVTWLTRSLAFIIGGAVLAFAVTAHTVTYHHATMNVPTVGVILLVVGVFDLVLNFGMSMYLNQPGTTASTVVRRTTPVPYPTGANQPLNETQVISRDSPNWR